MVHIISSEAVAELLRRWAGEPRLIVWHDSLTSGPVPGGLPLEELSVVRAPFVTGDLAERDRQLRRLVERDALWLWFGDGVADRRQRLQVLDFLRSEGLTGEQVFLVDIPDDLRLEQMAACAVAKRRVTAAMFAQAAQEWARFSGSLPDANELPPAEADGAPDGDVQ